MPKYLKIVLTLIVIAIFIFAFSFISKKDSVTVDTVSEAPVDDPIDAVLSFYNEWLLAKQSTTTEPITPDPLNNAVLTTEARAAIEKALSEYVDGTPDPVFCQLTVPNRIGAKELFALSTQAQVMVLTRGGEEKSPYQAIVTVEVVDGKWRITEISCAQGEIAPERAYDFEHEGFLLKSVPPPLDPQYWHLVYEENGQLGHTVPLFFSAESICIDGAGNESICVPTQFTDASPAFLQAAMTEAGAAVRRLQLK